MHELWVARASSSGNIREAASWASTVSNCFENVVHFTQEAPPPLGLPSAGGARWTPSYGCASRPGLLAAKDRRSGLVKQIKAVTVMHHTAAHIAGFLCTIPKVDGTLNLQAPKLMSASAKVAHAAGAVRGPKSGDRSANELHNLERPLPSIPHVPLGEVPANSRVTAFASPIHGSLAPASRVLDGTTAFDVHTQDEKPSSLFAHRLGSPRSPGATGTSAEWPTRDHTDRVGVLRWPIRAYAFGDSQRRAGAPVSPLIPLGIVRSGAMRAGRGRRASWARFPKNGW